MKKQRTLILSAMGELMGISPSMIRYVVLGIETIYLGIQKRSSCDVLHGIAIFTTLKKHTEKKAFDSSFDLVMRCMEAASPKPFSNQSGKEEALFQICFEIPSLLRGVKPSKKLTYFSQAYISYVQSEKENLNSLESEKRNLIRAKIAFEEEWEKSKLVKIFLEKVLTELSLEPLPEIKSKKYSADI